MNSDMEKTLDEILSGVEALLEQAPQKRVDAAGYPRAEQADVKEPQTVAPHMQATTRVLLAVLESDKSQAAHAAARRWLIEDLASATVALGDVGGDRFAELRVSAWTTPTFAALEQAGAVLLESDAWALSWRWPNQDRSALKQCLGRLRAAVCLDQSDEELRFRVPRIPERLRCRFVTRPRVIAEEARPRPMRYACIDQDNSSAEFHTVFWLHEHHFVPDHVAGLVMHQGLWWPLIDASDD
jgi:hypothetical protein